MVVYWCRISDKFSRLSVVFATAVCYRDNAQTVGIRCRPVVVFFSRRPDNLKPDNCRLGYFTVAVVPFLKPYRGDRLRAHLPFQLAAPFQCVHVLRVCDFTGTVHVLCLFPEAVALFFR